MAKHLVIFDSNFGNSKKLAEEISKERGKTGKATGKAINVSDFKEKELKGLDLIVMGCPIIGWRPTEKINSLLQELKKKESLKGIKGASFDTRIDVFFHGDAARQITNSMKSAGAEIISEPFWFFVKGKEGPLKKGEEKRAREWAKCLREKI